MSYAEVLETDRISQLSDIIPRFNQFVNEGDVIMMGIEGDPLYPFHEGERPMATVKRVDRDDQDPTNVSLLLDVDGVETTVPKNNIDPNLVWEFTEKSFQNVVERAMENSNDFVASSSSGASGALPQGNSDASTMSMAEMAQRLNAYETVFAQIANELDETRKFNTNVVRTFKQMSKDVLRLDSDGECKFCQLFTDEYKENMSDSSDSDSDDSDSDDDSDDSSDDSSEMSLSDSESSDSESLFSSSDSETESELSFSSESSDDSDFAQSLLTN